MKPARLLLMTCMACALAVFPLSACRVGRPFQGPGYDPARGVVHPRAGSQVLVTITRGDISPGRKNDFAEQLGGVLSTMEEHDGLIGYQIWKELLGSRVWTYSVWVDRESMMRFTRSPEHRSAVGSGVIARSSFYSTTAWIDADRVPLRRAEVDRMLQSATDQD